ELDSQHLRSRLPRRDRRARARGLSEHLRERLLVLERFDLLGDGGSDLVDGAVADAAVGPEALLQVVASGARLDLASDSPEARVEGDALLDPAVGRLDLDRDLPERLDGHAHLADRRSLIAG